MSQNNDNLNFSTNWNGGKLNNIFFTTIRIHNPNKYKPGKSFDVFLKGNYLKSVVVADVKTMKLYKIPNYICCLDTGYNQATTIKMIKKIYQKQNIEDEHLFDIILCKTLKSEI